MPHGVMEVVSEIKAWFSSLDGTFLRLFGNKKSPHILPRYATDKHVMLEVSYHLSTGLSAALHRKKKTPWPTLPMKIGLYKIKNLKVADTEGKVIKKFSFGTQDINLYDPHGIFKDHYENSLTVAQ